MTLLGTPINNRRRVSMPADVQVTSVATCIPMAEVTTRALHLLAEERF